MTLLVPRRAAAAATALLLTLGLAACSGSGDESASDADATGAMTSEIAPDAAYDGSGETESGDVAAEAASAADATSVVDREIVVTGSMDLVAEDPAATAEEISRMVEQAGGRIDGLTESPGTDGEPGDASLTVRIPADRTTSAVEAMSDVATVRHVEIAKDDVTSQGQNLDARISALTTSTDRLTELLASAGSTADLLEVERELATRQAELDALSAQRDALSDQVAMSTIWISITADTAPVTAPRSGFVDGLATGWSALSATVQTIVLVLGVLLPWLALAAVVLLVVRVVRRRRSDAPPTSGSAGPHGAGPHDDGPADDGTGSGDDAPAADHEREPALVRR
ncbi:DUF4349 domain-containing protein [Isoptericola jiangsuensis]|uniref:DUF4349 domain-containing protein n=1 Tax=Isoptericola jiangsuensis TaxID=548579 RepID=UPI003AAE460B